MGAGEAGRGSTLTAPERDQIRRALEHEQARVLRAIDREMEETGELLRRRGERDPCAQLSPTSSRDDAELVERSRRVSGSMEDLRAVEQALRRLEEEPARFGACERCESPIPLERLEIVPATRVCGGCAGSTEG